MSDTLNEARKVFCAELESEGDTWRILRKSTFLDLIKLDFVGFQDDKNKKHLINIFNLSLKALLLSDISSIEVKGSIHESAKRFNKENLEVIKAYDRVVDSLSNTFEEYTIANIYDLYDKMLYTKVMNDLDIENYTDEIFEEIAAITFNILIKF